MKQKGVYDEKRIFGVTTLDVVRSNTFIAEAKVGNVPVPLSIFFRGAYCLDNETK